MLQYRNDNLKLWVANYKYYLTIKKVKNKNHMRTTKASCHSRKPRSFQIKHHKYIKNIEKKSYIDNLEHRFYVRQYWTWSWLYESLWFFCYWRMTSNGDSWLDPRDLTLVTMDLACQSSCEKDNGINIARLWNIRGFLYNMKTIDKAFINFTIITIVDFDKTFEINELTGQSQR